MSERSDRLRVLISGCHSGPNPSPGVGIARSLRAAFPQVTLVAKDHSPESSGIHDPAFDSVWLCRPWNEIDFSCHRSQLARRLQPDAWLISGLDAEIEWLAASGLERGLLPPASALERTAKPAFPAASALDVKIPAFEPWASGEPCVHKFCRAHNWDVWVKGPRYEARHARTWSEVKKAAH